MIRPVTLVTAVMMLGSGAWMFVVKHQAEQLDQQIGGVTAHIRSSEQRIRVLRAEWALETDPNRLSRLAAMFMPQLKPMAPDQLVTWDQLSDRLPPPGATVPHLPLPPPLPDELPDRPEAVVPAGPVASGSILPAPPPPAPSPVPEAVPAARVRLAASRTARHAAHTVHRQPVPHSVAHAHHESPARRAEAPVRDASRRPQELGASVLASRPVNRPMGAQVMTITARAPNLPPPAPVRNSSGATTSQAHSVFGDLGANLSPPRPVGGSTP